MGIMITIFVLLGISLALLSTKAMYGYGNLFRRSPVPLSPREAGNSIMTGNKSINASDRLERAIIASYPVDPKYILRRDEDVYSSYVSLNANNGYDSGVNPTHSLETQVL